MYLIGVPKFKIPASMNHRIIYASKVSLIILHKTTYRGQYSSPQTQSKATDINVMFVTHIERESCYTISHNFSPTLLVFYLVFFLSSLVQ